MTKLEKSPMRLARHAYWLARAYLREYAHPFSPKKYTQPQLFVCLVLKTYFRADYRKVTAILHETEKGTGYIILRADVKEEQNEAIDQSGRGKSVSLVFS